MKVAYFLATLVAVVTAGTVGNPSLSGGSIGSGSGGGDSGDGNLYLSDKPPKSGSGSKSGSSNSGSNSSGSTGNKCADCVNYCHNDSNGLALGAACLIVKCGISCIIA